MKVRLGVSSDLDELRQVRLAFRELTLIEPPAKQLVPQPHPIRIDDVRLAVVGDLSYPSLSEVPLHFTHRSCRRAFPGAP